MIIEVSFPLKLHPYTLFVYSLILNFGVYTRLVQLDQIHIVQLPRYREELQDEESEPERRRKTKSVRTIQSRVA